MGCGSNDSTENTIRSPAQPDAVVVAALGDSITAGSPLWDPADDVRAGIAAADERSQYEFWAEKERPELEFRNCGIFGQRTDEILLRLEDCAAGAELLIVQGGINDIAQGYPVDVTAENLRLMVEEGKELGLEVVMVNVLPWNNGFPSAQEPIDELNRLIEEVGAEEGVEVVDFYAELEDPASPGQMSPNLSDDGDHPSIAGYEQLGRLIAASL